MNRRLLAIAIIEGVTIVALVALLLFDRGALNSGKGPAIAQGPDAHEAAPEEGVLATSRPRSPRVLHEAAPPSTESRIVPTPYAEPPDQEYAADDPLGVVLFGVVRSKSGKALLEGDVSLVDDATGDRVSGAIGKSQGYAIPGLKPGSYRMTVRSTAHRSVDQALTVGAAPLRQRLDITLDPALQIKVKILSPDGTPLSDAIRAEKLPWNVGVGVVATRFRPTHDLPPTDLRDASELAVGRLTDGLTSPGRRLPKEYVGILELRCDPPVFVSAVVRNAIIETQEVRAPIDEITFRIPLDAVKQRLCTFKATFVDGESGAPIAGATVSLDDRQSSGPGPKTKSDGSVVIENARPGLLVMSLDTPQAQGYERISQTLQFTPGETLDIGIVKVNKAVSIEGTLLDQEGNPTSGSLSLHPLDRRDATLDFGSNRSWGTEADGTFKITAVGRGRYLLRAQLQAGNSLATAVVDTTAGPATGVRLQYVPAVRVLLDIKPNPDSTLVSSLIIEDEKSMQISGQRLYSSNGNAYSYPVTLPAGTYTLKVYGDRTLVRSIPLTVGRTVSHVAIDLP